MLTEQKGGKERREEREGWMDGVKTKFQVLTVIIISTGCISVYLKVYVTWFGFISESVVCNSKSAETLYCVFPMACTVRIQQF